MIRHILLVLTVVFVGCQGGPESTIYNAEPLDPPPERFRMTYEETEECVGAEGDFEAVLWFVADSIVSSEGQKYGGLWRDDGTIHVTRLNLYDKSVIRHESIHDIVRGRGHPKLLFDHCAPESNY